MAILSGVEDVKAVEGKPTIQAALLVREAVLGEMGLNSKASRTAIVTVSGHIKIVPVAMPTTGVQFTLEEWERIVEFVESQTIREAFWINWNDVPSGFNYVAIDSDGFGYAYSQKPYRTSKGWHQIDNTAVTYVGYFPDINWQESLILRPGL